LEADINQRDGVVYIFCFKEYRQIPNLDCIGRIPKTTIFSIKNKQFLIIIINKSIWLNDSLDNNVKLMTVRNTGHCEKAGVLQEAGVDCKFCFKEGCILLNFDYTGVIGPTTTTWSILNKQLHLKIIGEFNWLGDTFDNNVNLQTIRYNNLQARALQEAVVICKFCCKEGCRLLHLDFTGIIGLTTTTFGPSHLPPTVWKIGEPLETSSQDRRSHCAGGNHQHRHCAVVPNINRPTMAGRSQPSVFKLPKLSEL
jgi:hypothetical protein